LQEQNAMETFPLLALREPLERKYRDDPESARVTFRSSGSVDADSIACRVETGHAITVTGMHKATGGTGADRAAEDMLLEALVGCAGVTLKAIAAKQGIPLRKADIFAEGDLDFRGTMGLDEEAPVGFTAIRLRFVIDSDADDAAIDDLIALTRDRCVVFQTLTRQPELMVERT
jgi:uncharacterized OsmC-like protein